MSSAPTSILRRKISAAESRRAERLLPVGRMSEALAGVLGDYFSLKLKAPALLARILDPVRLGSAATEGVWFLFRAGDADIVVLLGFSLTIAASNKAIGRNFLIADEAKPSLADRAIAAGLAQRAAAALASVKGECGSSPAFVQSAWRIEDIKIDRKGRGFEWYEADAIPLSESFHVSLACGVSVDASRRSEAPGSGDGEWTNRLLEIALAAEVELGATLGFVHADFGALMGLAPGAKLPVEAFDTESISLAVRGSPTPILSGKIGSQNGFKAIRVRTPAAGRV